MFAPLGPVECAFARAIIWGNVAGIVIGMVILLWK